MASTQSEHKTEIQDENLKVPNILSIVSNSDSLCIKFVFIKQAKQSIDNVTNSGHCHGGHAHKHGDEVVTIRKELQFHEIETEIKCNDKQWISLGGFRRIELLQKLHSHEHSHTHCHSEKDCDHHDAIALCYPVLEINQYLIQHQLQSIHNQHKYEIRMRLRYKIAYRVAHLSQQIDSIISCFSEPYDCRMYHNEEKKQQVQTLRTDTLCVSLCSNKQIQIDTLSTIYKRRRYLQINNEASVYPNEWLFYPSLCVGNISQHILSSFQHLHSYSSDISSDISSDMCSALFCYDGFNKDDETLCGCFVVNLNDGMWYILPSINNQRSRSQLMYAPNSKQLLLCGGYQYDMKNGTKYMKSMEYLSLNMKRKEHKLEWKNGLEMRTQRCEHSMGLITNKNSMNNTDIMLICGGSNDMFLRSTCILTVQGVNENTVFGYKRGGLMKEACIKGSLCHDVIHNNGDNVYMIGGNNGFGSTRNAQCFNLEKNRWNMIKATLYEHDDYPCVWMESEANSMYYGMIGVIGHSQELSCVEYYDNRNDKWISHCQYPQYSRDDHDHAQLQIMRMTPWKCV